MLRNPLKKMLPPAFPGDDILTRRAEELSWRDYVDLSRIAEKMRNDR